MATKTVTLYPLVNDDYNTWMVSGSYFTKGSSYVSLLYGYKAGEFDNFSLRFSPVLIPKGATITSAYLSITPDATDADRYMGMRIRANLSGDAVAPTNLAEAQALVLSSDYVDFNIYGSTKDVTKTSPNLSALIQQVVNLNEYEVRQAIQLVLTNYFAHPLNYSSAYLPVGGYGPTLVVTYTDETVIGVVSGNTDDKSWDSTALDDSTSPSLVLGYTDTPAAGRIYFRFQGMGIAQGATINSAKLLVHCSDGGAAGTLKMKFYGNAKDLSTPPTTVVGAETLAKTTAYVEYVHAGAWGVGYPYEITGLESIIQEIVDRPGWSSGNSIGIIGFENGGDAITRAVYAYNDGSPEYYATLEINAETKERNNMSGTMGKMHAYGTGSVPPKISLSLPALKITAEGVISHRAEVTLPKLSLSSYGTAYLFPPGLNVYADIYLPALTLDISSSIGSNVAAILPALTALGYTAYISGDNLLAPMTIEGIGNVIEQASLSSSLACLTISASGLLGEVSNVDITLPALAISGISTFVLSGNAAMILPHLVMYESRGRYSNRFTGYVLRYIRP